MNIRLIISNKKKSIYSIIYLPRLYDLDALVKNTVVTMRLSIIQERILGFQVEFY